MPSPDGGDEMRNRPTAEELLQIAEETLSNKVTANLPQEQRYNVAMIVSAIGIARRELAGGRFAWDGELDALQRLYATDIQKPAESTLFNLSSKLTSDFRAGVYDESSENHKVALNILIKDVLARLNEDSPRYHKTTS